MAWSFTGFRGSANNKTSGAVLTVSPSANIPAGAIVRAVVTTDNISTGGGVTADHVVADFKGNVWTKIHERSNAAAAGAGITASEWISQLTTGLNTIDAVVLGLRAAATAKAIGLYEYALGAGNLLRVVSSASSEQDNTQAPTVTMNGLDSAAYAFIGSVHREADDVGTYTQDTDYNDRAKFGTTGGTGNTNVSNIVGDRLGTLTGDTYNPTALQTAADVVTILACLQEVVPFRLTCTQVLQSGGRVYVRWSDGQEQEFGSLAEALVIRDQTYDQVSGMARKLAVTRYLRADPTAANPSILEGRSIIVTDRIDEMVRVQ